ncbi:MAG TPA: regulatory protein RecX [Actinomycetaceae bacterium]|nr:regulatory protein RecX [Actinomycetaceae bacterium]
MPTPSPGDGEQPQDDGERAREIALRQLAAAPRSRRQLADKLASHAIAPATIEELLDRFEAVGLVDDQAFADMLVRTRHSERGLARRALAHELYRYGIEGDTAQQALSQVDDDDELRAARDLVARRLRSMGGVDDERRRRRLAGLLARRGYPAGIAMQVVSEAIANDDEEADVGW